MNPAFPPGIDDELLVRFLSGEASAPERQRVEAWMSANAVNSQYVEQLRLLWQRSSAAADFAQIDTAADWQKVKARMNPHWQQEKPLARAIREWWLYPLLRVAAVAVVVLGLVIGLYRREDAELPADELVTTATSQPVRVTLPDGTKVHLNTHARLRYPKRFSGRTRAVELAGEAFFEVTPNKEKPFVIATGAAVTQVLGTSFSVNAQQDDSVLVTVLAGKVAFFERGREEGRILLTPGEQGNYLRGQLTEATATDPNFLAWHSGVLTFRNTPLPVVARDLSRYYRRTVRLGSPALASCAFSSQFDHQSLEEVLDELRLVLPLTLETKGDTLLLTGPGCP